MTAPSRQAGAPSWDGYGVFVTGGAAGIGLSLGRVAAARGAAVVLADIQKEVAEEQAAALRAGGAQVHAVHCDVTDYGSVEAALAEATERLGGINLVCANAGIGTPGGIAELSLDDFTWVTQVNLFGAFYTLRAALPYLREQRGAGRWAHVLVTGSENSLGLPEFLPPVTAYQTSKYALRGLTDCVRRDLAPDGIGATLLCPSFVATEGWNGLRTRPERFGGPKQGDPATREELHKIGQDPDEVAVMAFEGVDANVEIVVTNDVSKPLADVRIRQVQEAFERLTARDSAASAT